MNVIYSPLKIFHYPEKLLSLPVTDKAALPPLHIRIKPINKCNHNCRYCAYRADALQLGQDMSQKDMIPRENMRLLTEDIISMGVKAVTFSGGGEPLIYPYLAETLETLSQSPVKFAALTNGAGLKGRVAEMFSQSGTWIRISMDGWDDASYSRYRRIGDGEYSRIINNIKSFKKLGGKCLLGVSLIIDKENYDTIYQHIKLLKDLGVDSVKISPCIMSNSGVENNTYHKPFFNMAKEQAQKAKTGLEDRNFEVFDSYHELDEKFRKHYRWCPYQQMLPVVGADLNVYSCQDKAYNLKNGLLGSIGNQRFKDFWFGDKSVFFKIDPSNDCNHHCVANKKNKMVLDFLGCRNDHLGFV